MGATEVRTPHPVLGPRDTIAGNPRFSLENVNTFPLANGTLCWVNAPGVLFRYDRDSAAIPDGTTVVAPSAGPGRWLLFAAGGALEVLDEGVSLGTFTKMNFEGPGVAAAVDGGDPNQVNVTIPGGGGGTAAVLSSVYACPAGVAVRDAVFLSGADTVDLADSDDSLKQPLIGIVDSKPSAVTCIVTYYGEVSGFVGLTSGATYYLGTAPGTITITAPTTPGNIVQRMGFARSSSILVVMADRDWTEIT